MTQLNTPEGISEFLESLRVKLSEGIGSHFTNCVTIARTSQAHLNSPADTQFGASKMIVSIEIWERPLSFTLVDDAVELANSLQLELPLFVLNNPPKL